MHIDSINEAEKVKDAFHGQEVWGRTLSIQFSSGNPLDSNSRRDRNTDSRGDADGVRAFDERGRGDSPSSRGNKNRSNSGGCTDGRGGGGGGRDGDTGMNRSNRSGNVDSNDRGRDMQHHEDMRSSDGSSYQNQSQNQNQKRLNAPDVSDREGRTRDNFGNRNGNEYGNGNEHGIGDGDSNGREGNRLKSNFINRSRSRERGRDRDRDRGDRRNDNDNNNGNGNGNGSNNDRSGNKNNNNNSSRMNDRNGQDVDVGNTTNQKFDMPSISVIALPFGVSGGRFLYEHPDGRREYVEAMLSSSTSSSSSSHAVSGSGSPDRSRGRGRGNIRGYSNPRQNQYSAVSGEKR